MNERTKTIERQTDNVEANKGKIASVKYAAKHGSPPQQRFSDGGGKPRQRGTHGHNIGEVSDTTKKVNTNCEDVAPNNSEVVDDKQAQPPNGSDR